MQQQLFQKFAQLAHSKAGIHIKPGKEALVTARIAKRLRALSLPDAEAYLRHLESDETGEEMARFLDVISTHFTSFFRERDHFDLLQEEIERAIASGQHRFRIWSAASSSGEEPYTMAMTALGVKGADALDLKILATDIAVETLRQAARGAYSGERMQLVPEQLRKRWFERQPESTSLGEVWVAKPELKERILFRQLNLSQPPFPMKGPFDVVFCRNVLIYFDDHTRQRLISAIQHLLRPNGLLCVGHTETLSGVRSRFKMQRPSVFRLAEGHAR